MPSHCDECFVDQRTDHQRWRDFLRWYEPDFRNHEAQDFDMIDGFDRGMRVVFIFTKDGTLAGSYDIPTLPPEN